MVDAAGRRVGLFVRDAPRPDAFGSAVARGREPRHALARQRVRWISASADNSRPGPPHILYDGDWLVAEYNGNSTTPLRRYANGLGADAPLVWYEGSGTSEGPWLQQDRLGQ